MKLHAISITVSSLTSDHGKMYEVRFYTDLTHTCTCPAWFFERGTDWRGYCKHIRYALDTYPTSDFLATPGDVEMGWEELSEDDRERFRETQAGLYDSRPQAGDG